MQKVHFKATDPALAEVIGDEKIIFDKFSTSESLNNAMIGLYQDLTKLEDEKGDAVSLADYNRVISRHVVDGTAMLLGLDKKNTKLLENVSYSEMEKFFGEAVDKFINMDVPSVKVMRERLNSVLELPVEEDGEHEDPKA